MPYSSEVNALLGASSLDEMRYGNPAIEDSLEDYAVKGTASAVTSAAVGLANSVVGIGRAVGVTDSDNFDESQVIRATFGEDTGDFYGRHKVGVDAAGMLIGVMATGMPAIAGLRALQVGGKLGGAYELATGMTNADVVLGSSAVRAATEAALVGTESANIGTRAMLQAYGMGAKQAVLENMAFVAVSSLANNQNIMLNPEGMEKGAFESTYDIMKDNISSAWFIGGTAAQGVFEGLKIGGFVKKAVEARDLKVWDRYIAPTIGDMGSFVGLEPGDALLRAHRAKQVLVSSPEFAADLQNSAMAGSVRRVQEVLDREVVRHLSRATDGISDASAKNAIATHYLSLINDVNNKDIADKLAGLSEINTIANSHATEMAAFYAKTSAPMFMYSIMGGSFNKMYSETLGKFTQSLNDGMTGATADEIDNLASDLAVAVVDQLKDVNGLAHTNNYGTIKDTLLGLFPGSQRSTTAVIGDTAFVKTGTYTDEQIALVNLTRKSFGKEPITAQQLEESTMMHELGHIKNNSFALRDHIGKMAAKTPEIFDELYTLSESRRPAQWKLAKEDIFKQTGVNIKTAEDFRNFALNPDNAKYLNSLLISDSEVFGKVSTLHELLADATSMLVSSATRETAQRYAPNIAKILNDNGSIAMAWDDTRLFYNMRTGERNASVLVGSSDLGKARMQNGKVLFTGYGDKKQRVYDAVTNIFDYLAPGTGIRPNYMEASATWAAKSVEDVWANTAAVHIEKVIGADGKPVKDAIPAGTITVHVADLPTWERAIMQGHAKLDAKELTDATVRIQELDGKIGSAISLVDAERELVQFKKAMRIRMAASKQFNEQEIGHILNIENSAASGAEAGEWLLSRVKNFDVPENVIMNYKPVDVKDIGIRARSSVQSEINIASAAQTRNLASAEILGNIAQEIDSSIYSGAKASTQVDSRTSMLKAGKHDFGSARAIDGAIGKLLADAIRGQGEEINKSFANFSQHFNSANNVVDRGVLATTQNFIRGNRSILATFSDGSHAVVPTSILKMSKEERELLGVADDADIRELLQSGDAPTDMKDVLVDMGALAPTPMVGKLLEHMRDFNRDHVIPKKTLIAKAKGSVHQLDGDILYAPPMDLASTPHVAFVVPTEALKGSDPRNYMVYGKTPQELEEKINSIHNSTNGMYKVVYGGKEGSDVALYKKLVGDYDKGQVFDEQFFDAAKFKKGSSAELKPNMDLISSSNLNRMITWAQRQNEYILRSGVELKYADRVAELQLMDTAARKTEQGMFGQKKVESIYKDSLNMMLDIRSGGHEGQQLYKRINDWVGEEGSKVIASALNGFGKIKGAATQQDFDRINDALSSAGIKSPYSSLQEMILSSPDVVQHRQLNGLVRTANTIVGTLGLRLDMANSIVNIVSAPILAVPILRTALRDMPELQDLVSVKVPGTNLREPSASKLIGMAVKNFWGPEGKAKLARYKAQGLVPDFLAEYLNVVDDLGFSGNHTTSEAMLKFERAAKIGAKLSGHSFSESFTRFVVADAVETIGKTRGLSEGDILVAQINAIDQVHGIHRYSSKPQLFNGVVGQAVGLYQSYAFNMLHNMARFVQDGDKANAAIMTGLQASIFGLQGLPGFNAFNESLMRANGSHFDAYNATNADVDDKGLGSYLLYGAASHLLSTPLDLAGRGSMSPRNPMLVPTDFADIPAVSIFAAGVKNIWDTGVMLAKGDVSAGDAILHGLAHNGFNRPLQGLATIARGYTDTAAGQPLFTNANHVNYDELEEFNLAAMTARALGTRPLKESMLLNTKYRQDGYQAELRRRSEELGIAIKVSLGSGGDLDPDMVSDYAREYEKAGLPIEGFNSFWGRQTAAISDKDMNAFQRKMKSKELQDFNARMTISRSTTSKPWDELPNFPEQEIQK